MEDMTYKIKDREHVLVVAGEFGEGGGKGVILVVNEAGNVANEKKKNLLKNFARKLKLYHSASQTT